MRRRKTLLACVNTPFIVAEVGASHNGSRDRALRLIDAAAEAGADAVKFQCWSKDRMVLDGSLSIESGPWANALMVDLYREAWTPWSWFETLFVHARARGIECFHSVFDHEALAFLESLGCPRYKISSFEITDTPLIEAVARTGKPIVISTGMAIPREIFDAVDAVYAGVGEALPHITLLKCTSAYPAGPESANLATLAELRNWCRGAGVSDHTLGLGVPVSATALGATMIEKHLTLSRADGGPDAGFSSEPHEFKAMVDACREAALAIGEVRYGPTDAERDSLQFRRSLYWAKDIRAGEVITREHLTTARPALGIAPSRMASLIGNKAWDDCYANMPVTFLSMD